jgi:hypothetical protein
MDRRTFMKKGAVGAVAVATSPVWMPAAEVFGWGAVESYCPTHNRIVRLAYRYLEKDLAFRFKSFPALEPVLDFDVVRFGRHPTGTGPDVDGNGSNHSWHYYNPAIDAGKGPWAVQEHFGRLLSFLFGNISRDNVDKLASWACHFMADMNVPYHVIGVPREVARKRVKNPRFTDDEVGPYELYGDPGFEMIPHLRWGWGYNNDFEAALENYFDYYRKDEPGDWFDPLYFNGFVSIPEWFLRKVSLYDFPDKRKVRQALKVLGGSHANWEFDVEFYLMLKEEGSRPITQVLDEIIGRHGFYDELWENPRPGWGDKSYGPMAKASETFAQRVAGRTRVNAVIFWKRFEISMAYAVRAVYTLIRASQSAIHIAHHINREKGNVYKIRILVQNNNGFSDLNNVAVRLTFRNKPYMRQIAHIPKSGMGEVTYTYKSGRDRRVEAEVEVAGEYRTPDLGYARTFFGFEAKKHVNPVEPYDENGPPRPPRAVTLFEKVLGSWEFGRKDWTAKGGKFHPYYRLGNLELTAYPGPKKGWYKISNSGHANETYWKLEGNTIHLLHSKGRTTTIFYLPDLSRYEKVPKGTEISGPYRPIKGRSTVTTHYFRKG